MIVKQLHRASCRNERLVETREPVLACALDCVFQRGEFFEALRRYPTFGWAVMHNQCHRPEFWVLLLQGQGDAIDCFFNKIGIAVDVRVAVAAAIGAQRKTAVEQLVETNLSRAEGGFALVPIDYPRQLGAATLVYTGKNGIEINSVQPVALDLILIVLDD